MYLPVDKQEDNGKHNTAVRTSYLEASIPLNGINWLDFKVEFNGEV